jgi:hypothetical protein
LNIAQEHLMKLRQLGWVLCATVLLGAASLGCSSKSSGGGTYEYTLGPPTGIEPYVAPPQEADLAAGTMLIDGSGEVLSLYGFDFPPTGINDTSMVDGWQFTLKRYIAVVADVTLWSDPNEVPTNQSQHGPVVAHLAGPWAIDMHKGGPLPGKGGGGEEAFPFAAITQMDDGSAFDPTITYGFGFSTIPATANVYNVNLDEDDLTDYEDMIQNGYSVLYVGTATFIGPETMCSQVGTIPGQPAYDFTKLPPVINFKLGFNTPTNYVNCQNGTDLPGPGINGEDHPRGVQFKSDSTILAQVTVHMDHPFWESFAENSPLHWDQIASQYMGEDAAIGGSAGGTNGCPDIDNCDAPCKCAKVEDLKGEDFLAFADSNKTPLPFRTCVSSAYYTPPSMGQMFFNPLKVPVDIDGPNPSVALRDYYDYIRYTQATQGHLNSQGLCFIARQYPSPGGGS